MAIKIMAYQNALKKDSIWNRDNKCELITYIPDYRPYGGIGRVLRLFSNQFFLSYMMIMGIKLKAQHDTFGKISSLTRLHQNGTGKCSLSNKRRMGRMENSRVWLR